MASFQFTKKKIISKKTPLIIPIWWQNQETESGLWAMAMSYGLVCDSMKKWDIFLMCPTLCKRKENCVILNSWEVR